MQDHLQGALRKQVSYMEDKVLSLKYLPPKHRAPLCQAAPREKAGAAVPACRPRWAPHMLSCYSNWTDTHPDPWDKPVCFHLHKAADQPVCFPLHKAAAMSACLEESCQHTSDLEKTPKSNLLLLKGHQTAPLILTRIRKWTSLVQRWAFREVNLRLTCVAGMCQWALSSQARELVIGIKATGYKLGKHLPLERQRASEFYRLLEEAYPRPFGHLPADHMVTFCHF